VEVLALVSRIFVLAVVQAYVPAGMPGSSVADIWILPPPALTIRQAAFNTKSVGQLQGTTQRPAGLPPSSALGGLGSGLRSRVRSAFVCGNDVLEPDHRLFLQAPGSGGRVDDSVVP
jgi:hypothetical protein